MLTLPKRLSRCMDKGESFEHGMEYVSVLLSNGTRQDFCVNCWHKNLQDSDCFFWKGYIPLKKQRLDLPAEHMRMRRALELFSSAKCSRERYLLALYLVRKRELIRRSNTLYERAETGELFDIEPIDLLPEERTEVAQRIFRLLNEPSSN